MRVKQIFVRIFQMNELFPLFPGPENVIFSETDLVDVILGMILIKGKMDLENMNFDPDDASLLDLHTVLENIGMIEESEKQEATMKKEHEFPRKLVSQEEVKYLGSNKPFKKRKWDQPQYKDSYKDKKSALFLVLGGRADTHTLDRCFFKEKVKTLWNAKKPNKVYSHHSSDTEINAIVTKKVK